jgi:exosortase A-associated hydrolase 1
MSAPAFDERFVVFDCEGESCVGVLTAPGGGRATPPIGVVIVVGGPQYRVGSHRQFALLARALARAGIPVLRFDYRGMGDSDGDARTFEHVDADIRAAVDAFERLTGASSVVLWGLCDGASASMMYAAQDARVAGIVAVNPWARTRATARAARLRHYYVQRLLSREFWIRLASGKVRVRSAPAPGEGGDAPAIDDGAYLVRVEQGFVAFSGPVLFMLSGDDFTAREFEAWIASRRALRRRYSMRGCAIARMRDADHTFSRGDWRDAAAHATVDWIRRLEHGNARASPR